MKTLILTEFMKLKRSKVLWIAIFSVIMVSVIVSSQGQYIFKGKRYIDNVGWLMVTARSLATLYVLPAVICLMGSYMICREDTENTLKLLRIIPINESKLTVAKMLVLFLFTVFIYLFLFLTTFVIEAILHLGDLSPMMTIEFLSMYFLNGVGVYFAITPIVAFVAFIKKGYWLGLIFAEIYSFVGLFASMSATLKTIYPITATFCISGYYDVTVGEVFLSVLSLLTCALLAGIVLMGISWRKKL